MSNNQKILPPKKVSQYLGIPPAQLSRQTSITIGAATWPPKQRGSKALYSFHDCSLMKLGMRFLAIGLLPQRTQKIIQEIRSAYDQIDLDTDHYETPGKGLVEATRWLIGYQDESGFNVRIVSMDELFADLFEKSELQIIMNLTKYILEEHVKLALLL